jgi:hypothetical protein
MRTGDPEDAPAIAEPGATDLRCAKGAHDALEQCPQGSWADPLATEGDGTLGRDMPVGWPTPRRFEPFAQSAHDLAVTTVTEQRHSDHVVDHQSSGQQPLALFLASGARDGRVHSICREDAGQGCQTQPIGGGNGCRGLLCSHDPPTTRGASRCSAPTKAISPGLQALAASMLALGPPIARSNSMPLSKRHWPLATAPSMSGLPFREPFYDAVLEIPGAICPREFSDRL